MASSVVSYGLPCRAAGAACSPPEGSVASAAHKAYSEPHSLVAATIAQMLEHTEVIVSQHLPPDLPAVRPDDTLFCPRAGGLTLLLGSFHTLLQGASYRRC